MVNYTTILRQLTAIFPRHDFEYLAKLLASFNVTLFFSHLCKPIDFTRAAKAFCQKMTLAGKPHIPDQSMKIRNIFSEIERRNRAICLVAIFLAIYNTLRLLSVIAAPYPIDQITNIDAGISLSEYQIAFQQYIDEESDRLQMPPDSFKTACIYYGCLTAGYVIFSLFLGMRRKFARYTILGLIFVEIVVDIAAGVQYRILPGKISIIAVILLLLFLFSRNIAKEFE